MGTTLWITLLIGGRDRASIGFEQAAYYLSRIRVNPKNFVVFLQ